MVLAKAAVLLTILVVLFAILGVMIYRDVSARRRAAAQEQAGFEARARARAESRLQPVGSAETRARTLAAREASEAHAREAFEAAKAEARRRVDEGRRQRAETQARLAGESLAAAGSRAGAAGGAPAPFDPDATMVHESLLLAHGRGFADEVPSPEDGREVSTLEEVADGGFGMGSAAPLPDGAMPLGHPVKADVATMTYRLPDSPGYAEARAAVWFTDPDIAEWAGFDLAD